MGTKSTKPKQKAPPVTVVTTPLILATEAVRKNLQNAQRRFDRLTLEQQKLPVNAASMEALRRKVESVEVMRQLVRR